MLTKQEKAMIKGSGTDSMERGTINEIKAKHILKNMGCTRLRYIRNKKEQKVLGDIKFSPPKDRTRTMSAEVKTGRLYKGKHILSIDISYAYKTGHDKYYQQNTDDGYLGWLYHCKADLIIVVFEDISYVIYNGAYLLDLVSDDISNNITLEDIYTGRRDVPITTGLTGAFFQNSYKTKDDKLHYTMKHTYIANVDLDAYLNKNDIKYKIVKTPQI